MVASFDIADNLDVSGKIPSELGKLSSLQYLNIGEFGLDGGHIDLISYCVVISQLLQWCSYNVLGNNTLDGQLPSEFGELKSLEILVLDNNTLTGSIPTQIGNLTQLQSLDLGKIKRSWYCNPEYLNESHVYHIFLCNRWRK